jgi:hypothetical protein
MGIYAMGDSGIWGYVMFFFMGVWKGIDILHQQDYIWHLGQGVSENDGFSPKFWQC